MAHTDNSGGAAEQSRRTRGRLRNLGLYLIAEGVRSEQLILRSFAANRPKADNSTADGRLSNNRVEIVERPR